MIWLMCLPHYPPVFCNLQKGLDKTENQILKVIIKNGKVEFELGQLEDVTPLF